jgi:hypothetical protein
MNNSFFRGASMASICWLIVIVAAHAIAPPEPPRQFQSSGSLTVEGIVDSADPYLRRAIDAEVPWGLRWAAHKLVRWQARKVLHVQIAQYGHQVAPVLHAAHPVAKTLFRMTIADRMEDVAELCDTPVESLGAEAVEARREAGPAVEVVR